MPWRKYLLFFCLVAGCLAVLLFSLSILYSNYYGRMRDDEALNAYQISLPVMPGGTVPIGGGIESLRKSDPVKLINPLPMTASIIDRGRKSYGYYCVQCHGTGLDGKATVGQSFYPLPSDLLAPRVQDQKDGELFYKISLGNKRQPPLFATVATEDRWAVINYLRAMARNKGEKRTP
jgi:mono/diheme cytochrome c family protein